MIYVIGGVNSFDICHKRCMSLDICFRRCKSLDICHQRCKSLYICNKRCKSLDICHKWCKSLDLCHKRCKSFEICHQKCEPLDTGCSKKRPLSQNTDILTTAMYFCTNVFILWMSRNFQMFLPNFIARYYGVQKMNFLSQKVQNFNLTKLTRLV